MRSTTLRDTRRRIEDTRTPTACTLPLASGWSRTKAARWSRPGMLGRALARHALHENAGLWQRFPHLRPWRGRWEGPARTRPHGLRQALRRRGRRHPDSCSLRDRRSRDGLPELRRLDIRDVRQRPALPGPLREGPRYGRGRSPDVATGAGVKKSSSSTTALLGSTWERPTSTPGSRPAASTSCASRWVTLMR